MARTKKKEKPNMPVFKVIPKEEDDPRAWDVAGIIPVHFVGLRYYTVKSFIEEAKAMGVSRAFPPNVLKRFNWGDVVFLAIHVKEQSEDGKKTIPTAVVFGFFRIEWVQFKGTPRLHAAVANDPRLKAKHYPLPAPVHESRGCGEYAITGVTSVGKDVTLADLVLVIQEHAKRFGDKFKLMAGGTFYELEPAKLPGVKFTQNVTWVRLTDEGMGYFMKPVRELADEEVPHQLPFALGKPEKKRVPRVRHLKNYRLAKPAVRKGAPKDLFDFLTDDDKKGSGRDE